MERPTVKMCCATCGKFDPTRKVTIGIRTKPRDGVCTLKDTDVPMYDEEACTYWEKAK